MKSLPKYVSFEWNPGRSHLDPGIGEVINNEYPKYKIIKVQLLDRSQHHENYRIFLEKMSTNKITK